MEELNYGFFNNNWKNNSMDQNVPFKSALSSMVSSPTASNAATANGENIVLRELIGRIEIVGNNSCYNTSQNSPPKLNPESREGNLRFPGTIPFSSDPGFEERAARHSCFARTGLNDISNQILGSHQKREIGNSREISSISEQIPGAEIGLSLQNDANSRKRKAVHKGKGKATITATEDTNVGSENSESSGKRSKSEDGSANERDGSDHQKQSKDKNSKVDEAPKDYIHVRARRGQATDAHSLAERVRREKISERMKFLQDLVPGCNKVTGKAVMLDEIINYVQSLQRQVEFLSMKLSTVNPRMDFNIESLLSKDMFQSRGSLPHNMYTSDSFPFQTHPNLHTAIPNGTEAPIQTNHFVLGRNQMPHMDNFNEIASQISTIWDDDFQNVMQMGYGQNQTQNVHGAQMKVEQ